MYLTTRAQALDDRLGIKPGREPLWLNRARRHLVGAASNFHRSGPKPDIFMFSSPRAGSTFVMELMAQTPRLKIVNEPLSANNATARRALGVRDWRDAVLCEDRCARYARYFNELRSNRITSFNRPFYRRGAKIITDRIFFKIIHGGEDLLAWFEKTFDAKILLLLRHPIATAASQWRLPRLKHMAAHAGLTAGLSAGQKRRILETIDHGAPFELAILDWILQNRFLCARDIPASWTRISYEELILYPEEGQRYLNGRLALDAPARLAVRPSQTVIGREHETRAAITSGSLADRQFLINKWRDRATPSQIAQGFEMLAFFGIDYYAEETALPRDAYRVIRPAQADHPCARSSRDLNMEAKDRS